MILSINDLLREEQEGRHFRVLWIDPDNKICYLIDVENNTAIPFLRKVEELTDEILQGEYVKTKEDSFLPYLHDDVPEAHEQKRDKAWEIIRELVNQEPDIYEREKRGELVHHVLKKFGSTRPTVYKNLRRYWQRGMTPNALLPDYHKSGARGKERAAGTAKRGRPPVYGVEGINVDEATKKIFRIALEKYYLTTQKNNLTSAYQMMIKEFYAEDYYEQNGVKKVVLVDEEKLPTFGQFKYWYNKEYGVQETQMAREGRIKYEKDHRAVLGSSLTGVHGPGSRFQIDATVADVYLISRYNPDWIVGRPVMYVVVDVFSRMIVGMYIGLEGPSWMGAMMALANTASDKVAYCAQFGIDIPKSAWPCEHLPEVLLADRGELEGYDVDRLVNAFHLEVENAAPYRADWKGVVEKQFDLLQTRVKRFLPGYVEKDFRERGADDYRLKAKLTLEQFTQIMIKQIIMYNTTHYLEGYKRDEDMILDEVAPIPLQLWNWGIANRSGKLRSTSEKLVRLHLLPQENATVTYKGIKFKQMMYGCDRALREGWFPKARQKGSWKVKVAFDPRNMSAIYIWDEATGDFEPCHLLSHEERYENKTLDEVLYLLEYEKHMKRDSDYDQLQAKVDFAAEVEEIVKTAVKTVGKKQTHSISAAQKTKRIKDNRRFEREQRRQEEAFILTPKIEKPAEVIPLVPKQEEDYSRPSIKDFLKKRREQKENE
ncbi:Mu transposase C-terminal domain-containing protein [Tumebacillus lipolyticus]|uniref:Mu transposase C-terminal domain-containing protein n=1 Tax=Tumebacillus lipolyticus TaxID=1280370 RepID=A0ABW4ZWF1_9BACL